MEAELAVAPMRRHIPWLDEKRIQTLLLDSDVTQQIRQCWKIWV
jgi:hypothetical protein